MMEGRAPKAHHMVLTVRVERFVTKAVSLDVGADALAAYKVREHDVCSAKAV